MASGTAAFEDEATDIREENDCFIARLTTARDALAVTSEHCHRVRIYYEDTDHSGVVYHANYLRYFERAREHLLGVQELVRLWREDGFGFVVYKASMTFKEGAEFGDEVEIRTSVEKESEYRLVFFQNVWRVSRGGVDVEPKKLVEGRVELVCLDRQRTLSRLPPSVLAKF